jgi:hypothetical protein
MGSMQRLQRSTLPAILRILVLAVEFSVARFSEP